MPLRSPTRAVLAVAASVGVVATAAPAVAAPAESGSSDCPAFEIVAVPGTGSTNENAPTENHTAVLGDLTDKLSEHLESSRVYNPAYKAQAFIGGTTYADSKNTGIPATKDHISDVAAQCADTKFILTGYSQGADVAGDVFAEIGQGNGDVSADRVAVGGAISDPGRGTKGEVQIGPTAPGDGMAGPRPGGFGDLSGKWGTVCIPGDLFCGVDEEKNSETKLIGNVMSQIGTEGDLSSIQAALSGADGRQDAKPRSGKVEGAQASSTETSASSETTAESTSSAAPTSKASSESTSSAAPQSSSQHEAPAPAPAPAPVTGDDVLVVGDSIAEGASTALEDTLPGIEIDAKVSRPFAEGADILRGRDDLPKVVVVELGTNNGVSKADYASLVDDIHKSSPETKVVAVNTFAERDWTESTNDAIAAAPEVTLADWNEKVSADPSLVGSDGIHPTEAGHAAFADMISSAVDEATAAEAAPAPAKKDAPADDDTDQGADAEGSEEAANFGKSFAADLGTTTIGEDNSTITESNTGEDTSEKESETSAPASSTEDADTSENDDADSSDDADESESTSEPETPSSATSAPEESTPQEGTDATGAGEHSADLSHVVTGVNELNEAIDTGDAEQINTAATALTELLPKAQKFVDQMNNPDVTNALDNAEVAEYQQTGQTLKKLANTDFAGLERTTGDIASAAAAGDISSVPEATESLNGALGDVSGVSTSELTTATQMLGTLQPAVMLADAQKLINAVTRPNYAVILQHLAALPQAIMAGPQEVKRVIGAIEDELAVIVDAADDVNLKPVAQLLALAPPGSPEHLAAAALLVIDRLDLRQIAFDMRAIQDAILDGRLDVIPAHVDSLFKSGLEGLRDTDSAKAGNGITRGSGSKPSDVAVTSENTADATAEGTDTAGSSGESAANNPDGIMSAVQNVDPAKLMEEATSIGSMFATNAHGRYTSEQAQDDGRDYVTALADWMVNRAMEDQGGGADTGSGGKDAPDAEAPEAEATAAREEN